MNIKPLSHILCSKISKYPQHLSYYDETEDFQLYIVFFPFQRCLAAQWSVCFAPSFAWCSWCIACARRTRGLTWRVTTAWAAQRGLRTLTHTQSNLGSSSHKVNLLHFQFNYLQLIWRWSLNFNCRRVHLLNPPENQGSACSCWKIFW